MAKVPRFTVLVLVIAIFSGGAGFYLGRGVGHERGIFEQGIVSASTEALRTLRLLEFLDASKTSEVKMRLNLYLDEKLIELDALTQSRIMGEKTSSARESLKQIAAYRRSHPFDNPAGPNVSEKLRKILEAEHGKK